MKQNVTLKVKMQVPDDVYDWEVEEFVLSALKSAVGAVSLDDPFSWVKRKSITAEVRKYNGVRLIRHPISHLPLVDDEDE